MTRPARVVTFRGEVNYRHEAESLLAAPGDAALVHRGVPRTFVMACPDGCGETLAVNLDPRSGPAWKLYRSKGGVSLYPSVWREGGCESHFILWKDRLLWCDRFVDGNEEPIQAHDLDGWVLSALRPDTYRGADDIAAEIDEVPWEVTRSLGTLVKRGAAEESPERKASFRRVSVQVDRKGEESAPGGDGLLARMTQAIKRWFSSGRK